MDAQMKSNERARTRYAEAHPQSNGRWPDRTDMVLWLMQAVDNAIKRECDAEEETARVAAERDRAVARLKEISEIDRAYQKLTAERDRALARAEYLENELANKTKQLDALAERQVHTERTALADLAAERGRREKAEAQAAAACNVMVAGGIAIEPKVIAECMKERDAARAEVALLTRGIINAAYAHYGTNDKGVSGLTEIIDVLVAERDAARAEVAARESQLQDVATARREDQDRMVQLVDEVAALKARKVTLPPIDQMKDRLAQADYRSRCADAIRDARVDCE